MEQAYPEVYFGEMLEKYVYKPRIAYYTVIQGKNKNKPLLNNDSV